MAMPLIPVILPVFNGEAYLARALESLSAQTEPDFGCITVEDGSTDATAAVLSSFASRDKRGVRQLNTSSLEARGYRPGLDYLPVA